MQYNIMITKIKSLLSIAMAILGTSAIGANSINNTVVTNVVNEITSKNTVIDNSLLLRGVSQVAALWQDSDGTNADFASFVKENYAQTSESRDELFKKLSTSRHSKSSGRRTKPADNSRRSGTNKHRLYYECIQSIFSLMERSLRK